MDEEREEEIYRGKGIVRWAVLIALIAVLMGFGIPYLKRHFFAERVDFSEAESIAQEKLAVFEEMGVPIQEFSDEEGVTILSSR